MKKLLDQIYNEGLGITFYKKPLSFIQKNIKNKHIKKLLKHLLSIIYLIFILLIVVTYIYLKIK